MNLTLLKIFKKYYQWWLDTLLSCLPERFFAFFNKYKKDVELIVKHQGGHIYLYDLSGKVIDSVTASDLSGDKKNLDMDLTGSDYEDDLNDFDGALIDLSEKTEVIHHDFQKNMVRNVGVTVDETDITVKEDSTILINRDDKTLRLKGMSNDEDTLVIQDDQGSLLDLKNKTNSQSDSTVLYYSDRGKIRAVQPDRLNVDSESVDLDIVGKESADGNGSNCFEDFLKVVKLIEKNSGSKKCLYFLPEENTFSLELNYPIEALENIENVLRFDLEKHIPLSFQEVRFFYAINRVPHGSKANVDVIVIKSSVYDALNLAFDSEFHHDVICTTKSFYENYGTKISIIDTGKNRKNKSLVTLGSMHNALNLLLVICLFLFPYQYYHSKMSEIKTKSPEEIRKAGEIVSTINDLNSEMLIGQKLNQQITKDYRMIELLAKLSEHISTDAWISRFSYKNSEIKIKGEATSATSVSDSLNETGLFESIKFTSSIIKNPITKKETFELSLKVK